MMNLIIGFVFHFMVCLSMSLSLCVSACLFALCVICRSYCLEQAYAILSARDVKFLQFAADKSA